MQCAYFTKYIWKTYRKWNYKYAFSLLISMQNPQGWISLLYDCTANLISVFERIRIESWFPEPQIIKVPDFQSQYSSPWIWSLSKTCGCQISSSTILKLTRYYIFNWYQTRFHLKKLTTGPRFLFLRCLTIVAHITTVYFSLQYLVLCSFLKSFVIVLIIRYRSRFKLKKLPPRTRL